MAKNMPRSPHSIHLPVPLPTTQNHLDHREWVNHIRGPEERWEVDSTVTAGVALARLIPLGRGKKGDAISPTRIRKKKTFSQEWVHLYGNTAKLACWCLLEETIALGTHKCFFHAGHHVIVRDWKRISSRQWHCMRSSFMPRWSSSFQPGAISLANSEKMGRGAVRRTEPISSAIVSAPEFNLNVNLCRQDMNGMLSIKTHPAG